MTRIRARRLTHQERTKDETARRAPEWAHPRPNGDAGLQRRNPSRNGGPSAAEDGKRLARELHDETGQALTSILLGLKMLEQAIGSEEGRESVEFLRELVVSTLQDVRRLAVELRPSALDDFGLTAALERLVETHRQHASIEVDLEVQIDEERLPSGVETTLYRIVQEALTTVAKHADATRISILLTRKDEAVVLVVEDNGSGFDPDEIRLEGLGLTGMRERVALLGGRLRVEAARGSGTTIAAEVPLR